MNDAMADGIDRPAGESLFEPIEERFQGGVVVGKLAVLVDERLAIGVADVPHAAAEADSFEAAREDPRLGWPIW